MKKMEQKNLSAAFSWGFNMTRELPDSLGHRYKVDDVTHGAIILLSEFVERLIVPSKLESLTIQSLARVLLVLRRIPFPTSGVDEIISIILRVNEELKYYDLRVSEDEFELSEGGSIYNEGVGSDSYSSICFFMQPGGYIKGSEYDIFNWIDSASELLNTGASLSIESNDCDNIDWDENPGKCQG